MRWPVFLRLMVVTSAALLLATGCGSTGTSPSSRGTPASTVASTPTTPPILYGYDYGTVANWRSSFNASGTYTSTIVQLDGDSCPPCHYYVITVAKFTPQPDMSAFFNGVPIAVTFQPKGVVLNPAPFSDRGVAYTVVLMTLNDVLFTTALCPNNYSCPTSG